MYYVSASGLGLLRNSHDPKVTYEGDNNVLVQQTSNWLLRQYANNNADGLESPFGTATFLTRVKLAAGRRFTGSAVQHVANHACESAGGMDRGYTGLM